MIVEIIVFIIAWSYRKIVAFFSTPSWRNVYDNYIFIRDYCRKIGAFDLKNNFVLDDYIYPFLNRILKSSVFFIKKLVLIPLHSVYLRINSWIGYHTPNVFKVNKPFFLIKQNKSLTWKEVVVSFSRRQKTEFYAPLHSFWPLFISFSLGLFLLTLVASLHNEKLLKLQGFFLLACAASVCLGVAFWFSIFFTEKKHGNHNFKILDNIEMGFYLFLFTEALCFISLFWVFLHSTLSASIHTGLYNPGEGVSHFFVNEPIIVRTHWDTYFFSEPGTASWYQLSSKFTLLERQVHQNEIYLLHINFYDKGQLLNPYKLPLLNTFILLSSAGTLNVSHLYLRKSKFFKSLFFLLLTIFLGFFFVCIQYKEYKESSLQYNDGIYAACFFSLTGLHGFHVILGLFCLIVCFLNICLLNYTSSFHQSFHYSILYWHFVDIIWVLVYFVIYLWPSSYFFTGDIYATWFDWNGYNVHFSTTTFNKTLETTLYNEILFNNEVIYDIAKGFHSRSDKWKIKWVFCYEDLVHYQYGNMDKVWEDQYSWEADVLTAEAEYFDKTLIFFANKHPFKLDEFTNEFYLNIFHDLKSSINYNLFKKDPIAFSFFMTIMHQSMIDSTSLGCFIRDVEKNSKKILILSILYHFDKNLCVIYIFYFMPYLIQLRVIRDIFKLGEYSYNQQW